MEPVLPEDALVQLSNDRGLLAAPAGWERYPRVQCALGRSRWGRRKRWDHWGLVTDRYVLTLTFAELDYLGLATAGFFDRTTNRWIDRVAVAPLGWNTKLPDTAAKGSFSVAAMGLSFSVRGWRGGWTVHVQAHEFETVLEVTVPDGYQSLSIVAPWDEKTFQYTSKQFALPARAYVRVGGTVHRIGSEAPVYAARDYGRGVWPTHTRWNWGCAAGPLDGSVLGFNLGAQWTVGTGVSENGMLLDGVLTKIHGEGSFAHDHRAPMKPWNIRAEQVELTFTPFALKKLRVPLLFAGARADVCFGTFEGTVLGRKIERFLGWAEEFYARW